MAIIFYSNTGIHLVFILIVRYLLFKSRELCVRRIRNITSTNEQSDFCGCIFAVSFIREPFFQENVISAVQTGFIQWYSLTKKINYYRGTPTPNFGKYFHDYQPSSRRTLESILKELGYYHFSNMNLTTIEAYFSRCDVEKSKQLSQISDLSVSGR